jgi:hypothetical protein
LILFVELLFELNKVNVLHESNSIRLAVICSILFVDKRKFKYISFILCIE